MQYRLRFRQVHLDFHTSPHIPDIGAEFDKQQWQEALKKGHVNSITCFSKCHHGWSYHPTKAGKIHPRLNFDLLRAQFDACKEVDINVPIYLSAGVDNVASHDNPQWREVGHDGRYSGWRQNIIQAGFHKMCFNSPYLDYLCEQIKETVRLFPKADGIFLDIISQGQCCCRWCLELMEKQGLDAVKEDDRIACSRIALEKYYERTTEAVRCDNPDMPVFHNSGHISRGRYDILKYFSHLELESLPTGGWGYDHFPLSAKYCKNLDLDFLGMTGKFHTTWGEFGGYKHPNALRYECALMTALGAKCSVGDQLHPNGRMDESTYEIIGAAYREVEEKEPWCDNVENIADVGLLSSSSLNPKEHGGTDADTGACRILLESHILFDVIDAEMDFSKYRMLVLPDDVSINQNLRKKLDSCLAGGGRIFLTGKSGLNAAKSDFLFDIGARYEGESEFQPDYVLPRQDLQPSFTSSPIVMYMRSCRIKATGGKSLGQVYDPYFNRTFRHFCSHQHAPAKPQPSGYDCGVIKENILYLAHPVFSIYRAFGAVVYREYAAAALKSFLGSDLTLLTNLPSTAGVTLMEQEQNRRYVLHLLYANTINRGGEMDTAGGNVSGRVGTAVEVIEDLLPLNNIEVNLKTEKEIKKVTLEPQGREIPFEKKDGRICLKIDSFTCHQMTVLHY